MPNPHFQVHQAIGDAPPCRLLLQARLCKTVKPSLPRVPPTFFLLDLTSARSSIFRGYIPILGGVHSVVYYQGVLTLLFGKEPTFWDVLLLFLVVVCQYLGLGFFIKVFDIHQLTCAPTFCSGKRGQYQGGRRVRVVWRAPSWGGEAMKQVCPRFTLIFCKRPEMAHRDWSSRNCSHSRTHFQARAACDCAYAGTLNRERLCREIREA